jgi:hypothetical protein
MKKGRSVASDPRFVRRIKDVRWRAAQNEGHRQVVRERAIEPFIVFNVTDVVVVAKPSCLAG